MGAAVPLCRTTAVADTATRQRRDQRDGEKVQEQEPVSPNAASLWQNLLRGYVEQDLHMHERRGAY